MPVVGSASLTQQRGGGDVWVFDVSWFEVLADVALLAWRALLNSIYYVLHTYTPRDPPPPHTPHNLLRLLSVVLFWGTSSRIEEKRN